jgi:hypothetical protein
VDTDSGDFQVVVCTQESILPNIGMFLSNQSVGITGRDGELLATRKGTIGDTEKKVFGSLTEPDI